MNFDIYHVCAMLGHLSLMHAAKLFSVHDTHLYFCFISRLPKVSSVALLRHSVWPKFISDREKTLFCNAGTLCLSWASVVHEKLVCGALAIPWWFIASFPIWWIYSFLSYLMNYEWKFVLKASTGLLIRFFRKIPSVSPSVAKQQIILLYQPIHRKKHEN